MSSRKDVMRMIRARIGGPNSVTWPGFAITLALAVALNLVAVGMISAEEFRQGLISILLGQSAAYFLLAIARWTILSSAKVRPRPVRTLVSSSWRAFVAVLHPVRPWPALRSGGGWSPQFCPRRHHLQAPSSPWVPPSFRPPSCCPSLPLSWTVGASIGRISFGRWSLPSASDSSASSNS